MKSALSDKIGYLAIDAIMRELAATPKPGLVDRNNNGAHSDMDFFTFLDSAFALAPYFSYFAEIGAITAGDERNRTMELLREKGIEADRAMFLATKGVNTHKGMIFSMGLICGAAGRLTSTAGAPAPEDICDMAAHICSGICEEAFEAVRDKTDRTKGEHAYIKYGLKGIRGEAESGFRTVIEISLPRYRECVEHQASQNDAMVQTLLHLIASVHDTNIISRHDVTASCYAMERAKRAIAVGGVFTAEGRAQIELMDRDFIDRRISPGGSADLLAITYFLANAEKVLGGDQD